MISSRLKWYGLGGLLILMAVSVFLMLSPKHEEKPQPIRSIVEAQTILPDSVDLLLLREVPGVVVSVSQGILASQVTGLVEEVRVREGDRVKTGQVLILLDNRDLQAQLERVEAEVDNAKAHYERIQRLYDEESVSRQELDDARRAYKVAEAARKAIEANLAYTLLKAPFDGVITDKMTEKGEVATPGKPLLRLEDNLHLRFEAAVAVTDIGALRVGDPVTVRLDAFDDLLLSGRVAKILPAADPSTHSVMVKVDLTSRPGLKSGLFGKMSFPIGTRKALTLPASAVLEKDGLSSVYVVHESGVIQSRMVKVGKAQEERVEILSGLRPGERVLAHAQEGQEGAQLQTPPGASP